MAVQIPIRGSERAAKVVQDLGPTTLALNAALFDRPKVFAVLAGMHLDLDDLLNVHMLEEGPAEWACENVYTPPLLAAELGHVAFLRWFVTAFAEENDGDNPDFGLLWLAGCLAMSHPTLQWLADEHLRDEYVVSPWFESSPVRGSWDSALLNMGKTGNVWSLQDAFASPAVREATVRLLLGFTKFGSSALRSYDKNPAVPHGRRRVLSRCRAFFSKWRTPISCP